MNPLTVIGTLVALRRAHVVLLLAVQALVHVSFIVEALRWSFENMVSTVALSFMTAWSLALEDGTKVAKNGTVVLIGNASGTSLPAL